MSKEKNTLPNDLETTPKQKLLTSGWIKCQQEADTLLLQRGMRILAQDGCALGAVAALVLDCPSQVITHILLGQIPPTAVYRLIPLSLIAKIDEVVWLQIPSADIARLSLYQRDY